MGRELVEKIVEIKCVKGVVVLRKRFKIKFFV